MSGLWTPSGDQVPESGDGGPGGDAGPEPGEEELAAELARVRAELAATPVVDLVANHAVGLWQLAVLHLVPDGDQPPRLDDASVAIDAFAALVEGLGSRLGPHEEPLRDALTQLRLAFVQVRDRGAEGAAT